MSSLRRKSSCRPRVEFLEDRTLLTVGLNASTWTPIGPAPITGHVELGFPDGRTEVLAPDPTDPNVMYLAGDDGGVWLTHHWLDEAEPVWSPVTDQQSSLNFQGYHSLTTVPGYPGLVFGAVSGPGGGVLKSTDGGLHWDLLANAAFEGAILRTIVVNPINPDNFYVCVSSGGSQGRGVYRTFDGGASWNNLTALFGLTPPAATDLVMDPTDPYVIYAGLTDGGSSSGVWKSTQAGAPGFWQQMTSGILSGAAIGGAIRLEIAPSNHNTLYATVLDPALGGGTGGLSHRYRTTTGGSTWTSLTPTPGTPDDRYWHVLLAVDPQNASTVFANDLGQIFRSLDGGQTWGVASLQGEDFVGMTFDAAGAWVQFGDRGVYRSTSLGETWTPRQGNLQLTEFYSLTLDQQDPNTVYGVAQDQIDFLHFAGDPVWNYTGGGSEAGKVLTVPNHAEVLYGFTPLAADFFVSRSEDFGATWTGLLPNSINAGEDFPLAYTVQRSFTLDPSHANHLVVGLASRHVYETADGGGSWQELNPLPLHSPTEPEAMITALAMAPGNGNIYYVAATDGSVWLCNAQGFVDDTWTAADLGLFAHASGPVVDLRVDPADAYRAFAVTTGVAGTGGSGKRVWMTTSGGLGDPFDGWNDLTGDLPASLNVRTILPDWRTPSPVLYVGTERGVYVSTNLGAHWSKLDNGLPNAVVRDLQFEAQDSILAAATYGRGAWEILLPPPSITGTVFRDGNGNGSRESTEDGQPAWTVYVDLNHSGALDGGDVSTTTDSKGRFNFVSLPPGPYTVREVVQPGWGHSTPVAVDLVVPTNPTTTSVTFGVVPPSTSPPSEVHPTLKNVTSSLAIVLRKVQRVASRSHVFHQRVTLRNTSGAPLSGPLVLFLDGLNPRVRLRKRSRGGAPRLLLVYYNQPWYDLGDVVLQPGGKLSVMLEFSYPGPDWGRRIRFTPRVLLANFFADGHS